jgi:hypothetical protein
VVVDAEGRLHYDHYEGRWGDLAQLHRVRQAYAEAATTRFAHARGYLSRLKTSSTCPASPFLNRFHCRFNRSRVNAIPGAVSRDGARQAGRRSPCLREVDPRGNSTASRRISFPIPPPVCRRPLEGTRATSRAAERCSQPLGATYRRPGRPVGTAWCWTRVRISNGLRPVVALSLGFDVSAIAAIG